MTRKKQRLIFVLVVVTCAALAAAIAGYALRGHVSLFLTPNEALALRAKDDPRVAPARDIRLGGLVKEGSVTERSDSLEVRFTVTDRAGDIDAVYSGVLPDLFREGQGVVLTGRLGADGVFTAHTLLAKHDENYMPPEVAKELGKIKDSDLERLRRQEGQ